MIINKKVLVAIATAGTIKTETMRSIFNLFNSPPCTMELFITSGVYVDLQRNMAVKRALEANYDYILFIDHDMVFPTDLLYRLWNSQKDVVSTNYVIKLEPAIPMAMYEDRTRVTRIGEGLEKVYAAPTGTMLVNTRIFKEELIGSSEWFSRFKDDVTGEQFGEDVAFCEKCKRAGVDVYIHWDLTKQIGHVGDKTYTWNDVK